MPSSTTPAGPRPPLPLVVRRATADDRPLLERLWLLFRHDMSRITGDLPRPDGSFRSERLGSALTDPGWAAFTAFLGEAPVGFAFVRGLEGSPRVLNSFFVVAGARRSGLGSALAHEVLQAFPGRWEVAFQQANAGAVRFWRAVGAAHDTGWTEELRAVPGPPDTPPDSWISFLVGVPPQ